VHDPERHVLDPDRGWEPVSGKDHAQNCDATGAPAKSLIRMFGPRGNPQAKNLFAVIGYLQKKAGLHLRVAA
jgi:hypothetical protein